VYFVLLILQQIMCCFGWNFVEFCTVYHSFLCCSFSFQT